MVRKVCMPGLAAVVGFSLAAAAAPERALYGWTDADGVVRYTPDPTRIPGSALARTLVIRRDPDSGQVMVARWGEPAVASPAAPTGPPQGEPAHSLAEVASPETRAPAPPAPAPSTPVREAARYAIQLEAWSISHWAGPVEDLGLLEGRRLYRTTVEVDGRPWERIRLGFFSSPLEARAALESLAPHFPGAWIDRVGEAERAASDSAWTSQGAAAAPRSPRLFALQLGARPTGERLRALSRLELLDRHRLYRSTVQVEGATWERLRLGYFPTFQEAKAVLSRLEASYPEAWIARVDPATR